MKCKKSIFVVTLTGVLLCSCNQTKKYEMWENAPVVANKVTVKGGEMVKLDLSLLKDTIIFPLSHFMEEYEIIKLSDEDEALIYPSPTEVSDNYILVKSGRSPHGNYSSNIPVPCKLFDKKGNYITDIGAIGQGPGEYNLIYSMQIDEKNQRVYLMPWQSDKILVYDFSGKHLEPIQLPYRAPKAAFKVEGNKVCIAITPFGNNPSVAWIQTLNGEVLHEIPTGHFLVQDFSNEVSFGLNTDAIDLTYWNWPARIDSLYHIDTQKGELVARFTANFKKEGDDVEQHSYVEWPEYFIGNTSDYVYITDKNGQRREGKKPSYYIVDKKTLKGSFFRIENDYLDGRNVDMPIYIFNKGYYVRNIEPNDLFERIEEILKSEDIPEKMRNKLIKIKDNINEDDNNYIIYAKMKS